MHTNINTADADAANQKAQQKADAPLPKRLLEENWDQEEQGSIKNHTARRVSTGETETWFRD